MEILFWVLIISVVCIITGVTFYKPYLGIAFVVASIPFEGSKIFDGISIYPLEVILHKKKLLEKHIKFTEKSCVEKDVIVNLFSFFYSKRYIN